MWKGSAEAYDDHRQACDEQRVAGQVLGADRVRDPVEGELPRGSVDERRPEQEHGRAEAADDQVLEPCLERALPLAVDRAEDVERDREPLQPQEERHQVVRRDEEAHAGARRSQEGVELGDVLVAHPVGVRDADRQQARARNDHLRERAQAVAADRVGDHALHLRREDVDDDRVDERAGEAEGRRERAAVDARAGDHGDASNCELTSVRARSLVNDRSVIAAGQTDSASKQASSGTIAPSSAGLRSSASGVTAGPGSRCRTAEISRSMYMAASTIATAPTTEYPQPRVKTPARISNSPANADEPGTASPMIPVVIRTVARIGRPRAKPPSRENSPVVARRSIPPASRNSEAVIRPWLTICSTAPFSPRSLTAKTPNVINPICASDEYA